MDDPLSWIIIIICVLASFFFSCSETALACCNKFKISMLADDGKISAKVLLKILNKYDRALMTVLIGLNVVTIIASTISTLVFFHIFDGTTVEPYYSLISTAVITITIYIVGDALPKTIARAIPDTMSLLFVFPLYALVIILTPFTILFELITNKIEKMFKVKTEDTFTEEDFENIVEKSSDEGPLEEEQTDIMQSALELDETNVLEVYTPKEKMFAIDIHGLTHDKLNEIIINTDYSRIPVYDRAFDNIIGVLLVKTYLGKYFNNKNFSIRKILQKPYFVKKNIMIDDLFKGFKKRHTHIAIVKDSKNNILGMVTMEDVLEELVPNIAEPSFRKRRKA